MVLCCFLCRCDAAVTSSELAGADFKRGTALRDMSFSFNFQIEEDADDATETTTSSIVSHDGPDAVADSSTTESVLMGTTIEAPTPEESTAGGMIPGKRLDLDSSVSIDIKVPSSTFSISLPDGTQRTLTKVDEERAEIGDELVNLLVDDETRAHKDLVPKKYEGGLKVWEASLDLVRYLHRLNHVKRDSLFHTSAPAPVASTDNEPGDADADAGTSTSGASKADSVANVDGPPIRVLELGCGHGFPALYVLQEANVQHCAFTDYNEAVLKSVTWPTVLMNCIGAGRSRPDMDLRFRARYYAGDWV